MARRLFVTLFAFAFLAISSPAFARCPEGSDPAFFVSGGGLCLVMRVYGGEAARPGGRLVVVLHGDVSSGGAARYHFGSAQALARPGVVAVALVRPGYDDGEGRTSTGSHHGRRDHYTAANNGAIAAAIRELRQRFRASRVVLLGHSGGSAQAAVIAARGGIDGVVLVSCPCDIDKWRGTRGAAWVRSESPSAFISRMPRSTRVIALTGSGDTNTTPVLAADYVAGLSARGIQARFTEVSGAGHNFDGALREAAHEAARALLN